ncbi:hypothetical protein ACJMK2_035810, partial [Sinanodonta woodiana]
MKSGQSYRIRVGDKDTLCNVNLLKRYRVKKEIPTEFVVATVVTEEQEDNTGQAELLPSCPLAKEEIYVDVILDVTLTLDQRKKVESVPQ